MGFGYFDLEIRGVKPTITSNRYIMDVQVAKESRTKYVVLGLLSQGAETGYQIKALIEKSISYFWSESYGQIYPTLKNLSHDGLISEEIGDSENKREKKRYSITKKGARALDTWINSKTVESSPREEVLLKLFLCEQSGGETAAKILRDHKDSCKAKRAELEEIEEKLVHIDHPAKEYWLATLRFGIGSCRQRVEWAEETLKNFKKASIIQ